jgi:hypothetical protein
MVTALASSLTLLMTKISKYKELADKVNRACEAKGCPPAFDIQLSAGDEDDVHIRASDKYRFEGFGVVFGFPPKMSFWVHYLPESVDHVEIGRFLVPIDFMEFINFPKS